MSENRKIHVYKDESAEEWRWRKVVSSDETADSGEGYSDKAGAVRAAESEAEGSDFEVVVDDG